MSRAGKVYRELRSEHDKRCAPVMCDDAAAHLFSVKLASLDIEHMRYAPHPTPPIPYLTPLHLTPPHPLPYLTLPYLTRPVS